MMIRSILVVAPPDIDLTSFVYITSMVIGGCMVISSLSLAVCGAFKMNRSCIAAVSHVFTCDFHSPIAQSFMTRFGILDFEFLTTQVHF